MLGFLNLLDKLFLLDASFAFDASVCQDRFELLDTQFGKVLCLQIFGLDGELDRACRERTIIAAESRAIAFVSQRDPIQWIVLTKISSRSAVLTNLRIGTVYALAYFEGWHAQGKWLRNISFDGINVIAHLLFSTG